MYSSESVLKWVFLGMYCLMRPLRFSLEPRSQRSTELTPKSVVRPCEEEADPQLLSDGGVEGELLAVIGSDGVQGSALRLQGGDGAVCNGGCFPAGHFEHAEQAGGPVIDGDDGALVPLTDDGVDLQVPGPFPLFHHRRP